MNAANAGFTNFPTKPYRKALKGRKGQHRLVFQDKQDACFVFEFVVPHPTVSPSLLIKDESTFDIG